MLDILSKMRSEELAVTLIITTVFVVGFLALIVGVIAYSLRRYRERQLATSLILEMLDRGMNADDIVRVLSAAGLEDRGDEVLSLRQRWRRKLGRLTGEVAQPAVKS